MTQPAIAAIILAAGRSRRMGGSPKPLLPWSGERPLLAVQIDALHAGGASPIVVVTGHEADRVAAVAVAAGALTVHNADYATTEMLRSLQVGIAALDSSVGGVVVALGDQPGIDDGLVADLIAAHAAGLGWVIAPSHHGRRGHPLLIDRRLFSDLVALPPEGSLRDLLSVAADATHYLVTPDAGVLRDMDTPEDYARERARLGGGSANT